MSDTETNEASAPDHIRSQVQTDVNVRASTSDDACNDQEALPDEWNGYVPSRSRYGRTIKLRSIMSNTVEPPQNWRRRQLLNSIDNSMESIGEINTANNVDETSDSSATLNSLEEIPSPREIRPPIECPWMIGQLAWARVGNFPFWPCMVTVDPILRIHYKLKVTSRSITTMIHVHYFGDKGRHSWVSANCMMQFTSLLDFLKIAESLTAETKKKEPKYAAAFIIKPGARVKWQNAVQEATEVQPITVEERVAIFATKVKVAKSKRVKSVDEKNKNKRKHSIEQNESDELIVKRAKLDVDNVCNDKSEVSKSKNSRTVNDKVDSKINSNSLPSSPSSHKSSSESTNTKVIDINKMDEETMFKLYYLQNRSLLQNEYPNMPKDGIETYLRNTWNNMNTEYQKKLCSHMSEEQKLLLLKESALEKNESIEIETIVKENKKIKSKIDRKENFVSETKRNRLCKNSHSKENTSDEDEISTEIDTPMGENKRKNKIDKEENSVSETKRNRLRKSSHSKENTPDKDEMSVEADITVMENKKIKSKIDREENFVSETKRNRLYKNSHLHSKESSPDEDEMSIETPDITTRENKKRNKIDREENSISETKRSRVYKSSYLHSKESTPEEDEISIETETSVKENKKTKNKIEENSVSETKRSRLHNLFKGMKQEKVCQICEKTGKLTRCKGPCYSYFHLSCVKPGESSPEYSVDENTLDDRLLSDLNIIKRSINDENENNGKSDEQEDETFKCIDCLSGVAPACFLCNEREGDRVRCIVPACGKHYHSNCLKPWPQSHWQGGRLICPYHICHTCSSDNPQDKRSRAPNEKMARCVRCPSSYHASTLCLPAGSVILTASQIICPKHYKAPQPPLNAAWCFLCTNGGSLICCDTCPTSFHLECLGIDAPDGGFICEDCETGRLPLYGEVVWVKLGHYRWWPSRICYPHEIPENVRDAKPNSPGKFCVMFLGSNDYYWVHRGRAFLYQDGDANIKPPIGKKSLMDDTFRIALEEANKMHQQLKARRSMTKEPKALKPPPYVKLKVNKPVGNVKPTEVESIVACECDPDWDNPCAPGTDCLNRILMVECSPGICPAGVKCMNQSFVLRQYPAMEPFHTVGRGWGLRTLEDIKAGQFVIEYVGEIIDDAEYKRRLHRKKELKNENFYFLTIDNNRTIDAEPKGNLSRFMNHSCAPNCETQKWTVNGDTRIGLFALRDIEAREELTFNYNLASDGETRKACLCGASNCSGFIGLKAPKQQLSTAQSIMQLKKIDKSKRHKRWRKYRCWRCGQEISYHNKFIVCSQRTCNKKYHKTCVIIDESSESKFCCPWHFCSECGRRTSAHCSFCSTAFCQVHLDGNLFERENEKGGVVCKLHENADAQKPVDDEKEYSDNDNETDKEYSSTSSTSPIVMEKIATRESSPRVSIVEVHLSSEESEESQKEEEENFENNFMSCDKSSRTMTKKILYKSQKKENQAKELSNLTSSQLEAIIGVSLYE